MAAPTVVGHDDAIRRLVDLGLTLSEARCYVALLETAPATAGQLADTSGVPRPKVYGTLKVLEERRFCYPSGDRVTTYRPVDPDLALGEWTRSREHERRLEAERDRELRAELIAMLPHPPEHDGETPTDLMLELTEGPGKAMGAVESLMSRAEKRLDIVHAEPVVQAKERWNQVEIAVRQSGAQVRVLFATRELASKHRYQELLDNGCEARVARGKPLKLVVRDNGAEAAVSLRVEGKRDSGMYLLIRHTDLVAPIQLLFNREWRRATPLDPRATTPKRGRRTAR